MFRQWMSQCCGFVSVFMIFILSVIFRNMCPWHSVSDMYVHFPVTLNHFYIFPRWAQMSSSHFAGSHAWRGTPAMPESVPGIGSVVDNRILTRTSPGDCGVFRTPYMPSTKYRPCLTPEKKMWRTGRSDSHLDLRLPFGLLWVQRFRGQDHSPHALEKSSN